MSLRARRGSALILVLLMTLAVAALAVAAIFMTSSAGLLSRFYDKERLYGFAAESGLELTLARLRTDPDFAVADTGMTVVQAGVPVRDADGNAIPGANVFVYAMVTGDTTGRSRRTLTFIARAYDSFGTRHVRRMDVQQQSLAQYVLFTDSFPSGATFGPGWLRGRAHSNGSWRSANGSEYLDSLTASGSFIGSGAAFTGDTASGVSLVPFPTDSTYDWMQTAAAAANLSYTPSGNGRTRVEFVAYDTNGDSTIDATESYVRVFVLNADLPQYLRVDPPTSGGGPNIRHDWDERIVQNQCGAFYRRSGRWHFFPVATHRASWAWSIISSAGAGDYPAAPAGVSWGTTNQRRDATREILNQPTSRCFPAGSPYLVNTERMTDATGVVSGTAANNNYPWGVRSAQQYGGSDTTFTPLPRTCTIDLAGDCVGTNASPFGAWVAFGGTADAALPDSLRASHWPLHASRNAGSQGVVSINGTTFVSGTVRGSVTLRVAGTAYLIDQLVYANDPNDPNTAACTDLLGLVATGDILVADGAMARVRRYGAGGGATNRYQLHLGPERRFTVHGHLLSTGGTVGVENPTSMMGSNADGIDCPGPTGNTRSSGGCLALSGGAAMRVFSQTFGGNPAGGLRWAPQPDRCMANGGRPPFFPGSTEYAVLRVLEIEPSRANTNARIETLLRALRGAALN